MATIHYQWTTGLVLQDQCIWQKSYVSSELGRGVDDVTGSRWRHVDHDAEHAQWRSWMTSMVTSCTSRRVFLHLGDIGWAARRACITLDDVLDRHVNAARPWLHRGASFFTLDTLVEQRGGWAAALLRMHGHIFTYFSSLPGFQTSVKVLPPLRWICQEWWIVNYVDHEHDSELINHVAP